jgi:hypothetical protein
MHEILLPKSRLARVRNSIRHPDQAALIARVPLAGRRVPFRTIWRRQGVDPRRMLDHSAAYLREHLPALREQLPSVRGRLPGVHEHLPALRERAATAAQSAPVHRARDVTSAAARAAQQATAAGARNARDLAGKAPRGRMTAILLSFALGALLVYFFDAHSGRRRRALVRDRITHARRVVRRDVPRNVQKRTRFLGGVARGVRHNAAELVPHHLRRTHIDDDTLVARVRSEALRGGGIRPGEIHVDAYEGCVTLRGQLEREGEIAAVVRAVGRIEGVAEVRSYLHLPGTYPPNKAASLVNGHAPSATVTPSRNAAPVAEG